MRRIDCCNYNRCLAKAARLDIRDLACRNCDGGFATAKLLMGMMAEQEERARQGLHCFELGDLEVGEAKFIPARRESVRQLRKQVLWMRHLHKPKAFLVRVGSDEDGVVCERVA